jgi:TolB protein
MPEKWTLHVPCRRDTILSVEPDTQERRVALNIRFVGRGRITSHGRALALLICLIIGTTVGCAHGGPAIATAPVSATNAAHRPPLQSPSSPTLTPVATATRTPVSTSTSTITPLPSSTSMPTPTLPPTPTREPRQSVIAFVSDWAGDDDVYLLNLETGDLINLTRPLLADASEPGAFTNSEERDPAIAPDGRTLAFRSNAGGFWVLYQVDLLTGKRTVLKGNTKEATAYVGRLSWNASGEDTDQYVYESYHEGNLDLYLRAQPDVYRPLTQHRAGDYAPAWRPGARQIAFASWREGNKDLYLVDTDGGHLTRLTAGPGDHEFPAWHPDGRRLAYVRWQEGDADLWELDLDSGQASQLTNDPYPDRSPAYAPNGDLIWTRYVPGAPFEAHDPYRPGRWQLWTRTADGQERPVTLPIAGMDVYTPVAGTVLWPETATPLAGPTPTPTRELEQLAELVQLDVQVAGNHPRLHSDLAASYEAWRAEVAARSGYDLLGRVSDMFRPLGYSSHPYGHLSWHRAGRAIDLLFEWHDPLDGPNRLLVVREDLGPQTYWRLYLRCRDQDGTMGEPLTVSPWVFWFEIDRRQEPAAYDAGGKPGSVPEGYYVDVTRLAERHGWHRIAAYEEQDFDWRWDSLGREFWHYQRTDGLTWWQAMGQIYAAETLEQYYGWAVCVDELGLAPAWVKAKGVPTPAP